MFMRYAYINLETHRVGPFPREILETNLKLALSPSASGTRCVEKGPIERHLYLGAANPRIAFANGHVYDVYADLPLRIDY